MGNWHLGHANAAHVPRSRGFDHFYGHLHSAIEGGIRASGFARWTGKLKPCVLSEMVTGYDMLPTLAAACGIPCRTRKPLDGIRLAADGIPRRRAATTSKAAAKVAVD